MTFIINYWAVLVCGVASMITGSIWYGPLFGKKWAHIIGASNMTPEECKKMQKAAGPLYLIQFLLSLLQAYILAHFIQAWGDAPAVKTALFIWLGFLMPTVAAGSMWNNDSAKTSWSRFLIQAVYNLLNLVIFALILGMWKI